MSLKKENEMRYEKSKTATFQIEVSSLQSHRYWTKISIPSSSTNQIPGSHVRNNEIIAQIRARVCDHRLLCFQCV